MIWCEAEAVEEVRFGGGGGEGDRAVGVGVGGDGGPSSEVGGAFQDIGVAAENIGGHFDGSV